MIERAMGKIVAEICLHHYQIFEANNKPRRYINHIFPREIQIRAACVQMKLEKAYRRMDENADLLGYSNFAGLESGGADAVLETGEDCRDVSGIVGCVKVDVGPKPAGSCKHVKLFADESYVSDVG
jgi:hypothetical protein